MTMLHNHLVRKIAALLLCLNAGLSLAAVNPVPRETWFPTGRTIRSYRSRWLRAFRRAGSDRGWGAGKVALFVGREMVERDVPSAEAPQRLVELIRRRGRWTDPEQD